MRLLFVVEEVKDAGGPNFLHPSGDHLPNTRLQDTAPPKLPAAWASGPLTDPQDDQYRVGDPVQVRRGDGSVVSAAIIELPVDGFKPGIAEVTLLGLRAAEVRAGDEVWVGTRTRADMHRAFMAWYSFPITHTQAQGPHRFDKNPVTADQLDMVEAALATKLPIAYREFMTRCGTGEYGYTPLHPDSSFYCHDAHGETPLSMFAPEQMVATTKHYSSRGLPGDVVVVAAFRGWGPMLLLGFHRQATSTDDAPVMSFEWPYTAPAMAMTYSPSFDEVLTKPLDAQRDPHYYTWTKTAGPENHFELGRELQVHVGPNCRYLRYWLTMNEGRHYQIDLRTDNEICVPYLQIIQPDGSQPDYGPSRFATMDKSMLFACSQEGIHWIEGYTFAENGAPFGGTSEAVFRVRIQQMALE